MHLSSELTKGISGRFAYGEIYTVDGTSEFQLNFRISTAASFEDVNPSLSLWHSCVFGATSENLMESICCRAENAYESIHGKSYGNRRNNRVLPEISYYPAVLLAQTVCGWKQPCRDERGDRNVTECFKRVSDAGYSAHEARTLQINQGSSGFRRGESMRAASRCAFLNGQKGRNDTLEKTDGKGGSGGGGTDLPIYRLKNLNNNSCLVREQLVSLVNTRSMRLNLSPKCFNLRWRGYKFVLYHFAFAQTHSQRDALFARK